MIGPNENIEPTCGCCVCQGRRCFMWHPGHNHADAERDALSRLTQSSVLDRATEQEIPASCVCVCGHRESMHNPDAEPDTCHGDNDTCECRGFMDARAALPVPRSPERQTDEKDHGAGLAADVNDTGSSTTETASGKDYDASLEVTLEHGALVIRIGIKTLAHACTYSDWANPYNEEAGDYIRTFAIIDATAFAKDIGLAMENEREDGSSPLTDFIDKMSQSALDEGSMGQHTEEVRIKHGEKSPLETW